ncbi:MAG: aconitate hydratase AcnA [Actinobacteria bacterium]|nr:aconitate hydratase AcnA [Actinomycetota bacterium]
MDPDRFGARRQIDTPLGRRTVFHLAALGDLRHLPYSIRVLLEGALRHHDGAVVDDAQVLALAGYDAAAVPEAEVAFQPGRVVLQDFTGVPAVADLAAMRSALVRLTGDPAAAERVNPQVPADLVIDHSVQVDAFASPLALALNGEREFARNRERYRFLKWGQGAFSGLRVVPPARGIVHQVNLEYLARVVWDDGASLYPDTLVGTDSHTTMVNGLGVLGWGVGGIEAEAAMVGQPISMLLPEVVGVRFHGRLPAGTTATDLVLRVTEVLRRVGVVGRFVEFGGPGLAAMPLADRATIANMCPEYGATVGFFPVDGQTLAYLRLTGRSEALVEAVEQYCRLQGLWREEGTDPNYAAVVEIDLESIVPSLAGPRRPQDRVDLDRMQTAWRSELAHGFKADPTTRAVVAHQGGSYELGHGSVVIAAITSCTNTSNPDVMVAAGLLARRARERGLSPRPWVKTSFAPGSTVVTRYLAAAGLMEDLEALGFHVVGYGCTTCIGNSGPLPEPVAAAVRTHQLVAAAVLSGNRNFEGRISPDVRANYLASPPLVVAYALAGTVDLDLTADPLGHDREGRPVFLRDLWPTGDEIAAVVARALSADQFREQYAQVFSGSPEWEQVEAPAGSRYAWDPGSTYIQEPPFFADFAAAPAPLGPIRGGRVLLFLGDSVTTDHISPAGSIHPDSPAGRYLISQGVAPADFNSYGSRRGNDRVMVRGTFANPRIRNRLAPGTEGGYTTDFTDGTAKPVFDAAASYGRAGIPLLVLAGKDYGMGSSRDWAAKGPYLLGVRAVLAESFERIHRSNLVMMGILPLTYPAGADAASLGLDGTETYDVGLDEGLSPRSPLRVAARRTDGSLVAFDAVARVDTPVEVEYLHHGGILAMVLRRMAAAHAAG